MQVKVRIRGIYSTAISKLLHDEGITLVDVSDTIAKRLGIDRLKGEAADVTIKSDDDDPSNILVIGFPEAVKRVTGILATKIPYTITFLPKIGLYSAFKTSIISRRGSECIAETPLGPAPIVDVSECEEGREVYVSTIKIPLKSNERIVLSSRLRVVGHYAIVSRGNKITFSNYIRSKERVSELVTLSSSYVRRGYSIHWRSNADEAKLEDVIKELDHLILTLDDLERKVMGSNRLEVVYDGEYIALIMLTAPSKNYLDSVRSKVIPTAPYHHQLRCVNDRLKDVVDILDIISNELSEDRLGKCVRRWLVSKLSEYGDVVLRHVKLDGRTLTLGRGRIKDIREEGDAIALVMERVVEGKGVYDGIESAKDVGDRIITEIAEGCWWVKHTYFSATGDLRGIYININTPPEILPTGYVRYIDLGIDLVRRSNGLCKVIDANEFRDLTISGIISPDIMSEAVKTLDRLILEYCLGSNT